MAAKSDTTSNAITEETSVRVDRVTIAMARGEEVSAEDEAWIKDFNGKQEIIQTALTEGRHVENFREELSENLTQVTWTEYVPLPDGNVLIRRGIDEIQSGEAGDTITRMVTYWGDDSAFPKGSISSIISGGSERITQVMGFGKGHEYAGLGVGDTRPSPVPSTGAAGQRPQSWDPGSGSFGTASGGSGQTSATDPTNSDRPTAPSTGGPDAGDPMTEAVDADPVEGTQGGSDAGDPMPDDSVDPDPGPGDQGGSDGGDASSAQTNDQPPPAEQTQQSSGTTDDAEFTVEGSFEHVENVNTGQVGAKTESGNIATTVGTVKPVEGHWEDTDKRTTDDGYSYIGEPPPASHGMTDQSVRSSDGGGGGGARSESFNPNDPAHASSLVTQFDPDGAPIDYGNASDPFYDPVVPDSGEMAKPDEVTPYILVDPSFYEESATARTTRLEMQGSLINTGNPLDENQAQAPAGGIPNTSEQELVVGDVSAAMIGDVWSANEPDLGAALEAPSVDEGAPGAFSYDDPLP